MRTTNYCTGVLLLVGLALAPLGGVRAQEGSGFRVNPSTETETASSREGGASGSGASSQGEGSGRQPTEITASRETSFDEKTRTAVFLGNVSVRDEQFHLRCERLTAQLRRPASGQENPAEGGGGLEKAIAEGEVVIVQEKRDEKGKVTRYVGKARKAEYNAATGNVTLSGWPQIQQGINTQVATEEGTVMILNRAGALKTIGASKTVISDTSEQSPAQRGQRSKRPAGNGARP